MLSLTGFLEAKCHAEVATWQGDESRLQPSTSQQETEALSSRSHKELNAADNRVSLELDSSPVKLQMKLKPQTTP